nr:hypothetical protein [Tanacetum cinerariifolium]
MTDVKLIKDFHTMNFDLLHAYLEQHELHANEVYILRERNQDPLAFVANQQMTPPHFNTYQSSYNNPQLQQQFSPSHMPKRPRNAGWYKKKAMLAEAQEARQILDEEQLTFLADLRVPDGQAVQTIILNNAAFQTEDLDTYDSDCDDLLNAQAVLMAKISNYGSDVILEVPHSKTYLNVIENQSVLAMQDFEQPPAVDSTDNEIHSNSNIILYSQYLQETQQETIQDTHLQTQQDSMILSVIEQMSEQMINHVNN